MYALPPERKKYLVRQNRDFKIANRQAPASPQATYPASFGPVNSAGLLPRLIPQLTGDAGLIRRFSVIGWGSGATSTTVPPLISSGSNGSSGEFNSNSSLQGNFQAQITRVAEDMQPLQPQSTGNLWTSWWASAGGEKFEKDGENESAKSAKWYIDGLRIGKVPDVKLVKHLITLRVHLSTAKLAFISDFVTSEKGLIGLGTLLSGLVGKGGKKKVLSEIETTVLLEVLKCLRVLLNTAVRGSFSIGSHELIHLSNSLVSMMYWRLRRWSRTSHTRSMFRPPKFIPCLPSSWLLYACSLS